MAVSRAARVSSTLDFIFVRVPPVFVRRIERKTLLLLAGVLIYALATAVITYLGMPLLDAYYKSHPIDNVARVLVFLAGLWILAPLLPMSGYFYFYGIAIVRAGRHPPPGWTVLLPKRVMVGRRATVFGVSACAFGVTTFIAFAVMVGYWSYMLFAR